MDSTIVVRENSYFFGRKEVDVKMVSKHVLSTLRLRIGAHLPYEADKIS